MSWSCHNWVSFCLWRLQITHPEVQKFCKIISSLGILLEFTHLLLQEVSKNPNIVFHVTSELVRLILNSLLLAFGLTEPAPFIMTSTHSASYFHVCSQIVQIIPGFKLIVLQSLWMHRGSLESPEKPCWLEVWAGFGCRLKVSEFVWWWEALVVARPRAPLALSLHHITNHNKSWCSHFQWLHWVI